MSIFKIFLAEALVPRVIFHHGAELFHSDVPHPNILCVLVVPLRSFCYLCPQRSYEWNCRTVSLIHAVTIVVMSYVFGIYYNPWPFTHPGNCNLLLMFFFSFLSYY